MIVVFDTNIWKSEVYLQSPAAAALRFFLREQKARVGLPEVLRLEVQHHLRADIKSIIDKLKDQHGRLLRLFGQMKELSLPADEAIEDLVARVFDELGSEVIDVPFSLSSAHSSFLKIIQKIPPSDQTQEFKDGVIWANCVELLEIDDVYLVTNDKAFYADRKVADGVLAPNLAAELAGKPYQLTIMAKLTDLLTEVHVDYDISAETISAQVMRDSGGRLVEQLARHGFSLGETITADRKLFATEHPRRIFVTFLLRYECPDLTNTGGPPAMLTVSGDGTYDAEEQAFRELRTLSETIQFRGKDGTDKEVRNVFVHAETFGIGHRVVPNIIRYPLERRGPHA
jgi:hypothetical protein